MSRVRLTLRGEVQGVGFRYFAQRAAEEFGIAGYAVNLPGGEVRIEAEGPREALSEFLSRVERGPAGARVTSISREELHDLGDTGFTIRRG